MAYSRDQLVAALYAAADRYGIDRGIAYRQIDRESRFNPNAVSPVGAQGIAQFMPATAARFGLSNPFDPIASFDAWGRYMRLMLNMFGERYDLALAGYNSGENRAEYAAAARDGRLINWSVLPAGVQRETRPYVEAIMGGTAQPPVSDPPPDTNGGLDPGGDVPFLDPASSTTPLILIGAGALLLLVLISD